MSVSLWVWMWDRGTWRIYVESFSSYMFMAKSRVCRWVDDWSRLGGVQFWCAKELCVSSMDWELFTLRCLEDGTLVGQRIYEAVFCHFVIGINAIWSKSWVDFVQTQARFCCVVFNLLAFVISCVIVINRDFIVCSFYILTFNFEVNEINAVKKWSWLYKMTF